MGDALKSWPVLKCHSGLPVCASRASNESASSPKKSKPPAVVMVPPEEWAWPACGYRREEFAGHAVEYVDEPVAIGFNQLLARPAFVRCINQNWSFSSVIIKKIMWGKLKVPLQFSRIWIEG